MRRSSHAGGHPRTPGFVALVAALGLVFTACGGGGGTKTEEGQTDGKGKGGPSATAYDINPVARDKVADGGQLQWPVTEIPPNLNYHHLDGTLRDTSDIMTALMPSLFIFDAESVATINPNYLVSAELTATQPKQVVTYKFNPKAVWSDGTPIGFADIEAQWKAQSGTNPDYKISSKNGYEQIESVVKGADDREAVVTYKQPYTDWKGLFSPLYPASTNNDPKVYNEGWIGKIPVTAGPFKFGVIDETAKTLTIVRDDKWWGDRAKLDRIVFRAIPSDGHIDALINGEVDFIDVGPDVNKLTRAQQAPNLTIHKAAGPNFRHITVNGKADVLKDVKVRRALAMAINRDQIAKTLLGPLGVEAKPLQNHLFMANQKGYKDNAGALSSPNVEEAKKLLDEAGWTVQGEFRKKDGKELAIRFVIPSNVASSQQESSLVFNMLKAINVKVIIDSVPSDDFFEKYVNTGNFDVTVFSWIGTPFPISSSKSIYAEPKGDDIQQNYARIGSPELDALFDKATSEFDEQKAIDIGNEIDAMIWDEVHSITLYQRPEIVATKSNLANFGAFGFATPPRYEDIGFTK
ncbi:MAG TPA: ABC transporter family substrate-binding protein, partial [Acidimicrobiia bacterium]|nr:ABC transporter family substrate-binding protein [Acidimicrobiia bacterium]